MMTGFLTRSLSIRFAITAVAVSWMVFALIAGINTHLIKQSLLQDTTQRAKLITENTTIQIQQLFSLVKSDSERLLVSLQAVNYDIQKIQKIVIDTLQKEPFFYGMAIAFEPGTQYSQPYCPYYYKQNDRIAFRNLAKKDYNYLGKPWFTEVKKSLAPRWSEPYFDQGGGDTLMTTYATPILEDGQFIGILTVDLSLEKLQHIINSIHILKSGYAFLLSGKNKILAHPDSRLIMQDYHPAPFVYNQLIQENQQWLYYTPINATRLLLGIVLPDKELFASLRAMILYSVMLAMTGTLLLVFSMFVVSRRIIRPLKQLAALTQDISSGDFDQKITLPNSHDEIYHLSEAFNRMQDAIKQYIENLKIATIKEQKVKNELAIAKTIQMSLLPPKWQGDKQICIATLLQPATTVGGDFYDYFNLDNNRLCILIADVAGKGIPAAIYMATAISYARAYGKLNIPLVSMVKKLNHTLAQNNESSMFVTFFLAILDSRNGKLDYINAGHTEPYIVSATKKVLKLNTSGNPPLGAFEGVAFIQEQVVLRPNEKLFLFTDGINEAFSLEDEPFGCTRLVSILEKCGKQTADQCIDVVMDALSHFTAGIEQSDDITLLCVEYGSHQNR